MSPTFGPATRNTRSVGEGRNAEAGLMAPRGETPARTLAQQAFATLHAAIIARELEPGMRLPIEELASQLGMSPMPVREALQQLASDGLVEFIPHRGARVAEVSTRDLLDIYEARLRLEPLAASHAAERLTDEDEADIVAAHSDLSAAIKQGAPEVWAIHTRFHMAIYRASHSAWLVRLISPL